MLASISPIDAVTFGIEKRADAAIGRHLTRRPEPNGELTERPCDATCCASDAPLIESRTMSFCARTWSMVFVLVGVANGCGSSSSASNGVEPTADGGSPADGGSAADAKVPVADGQLAVKVVQARQANVKASGALTKSKLQVAVILANGKGGQPVPLEAALFSLRTTAGLLKAGSPVVPDEVHWVTGVDANASDQLAGAAQFGPWVVEFDVDAAVSSPVDVTFKPPSAPVGGATAGDPRSATAPLTIEACAACGEECTYLDSDPHHCGECATALDAGFSCKAGQPGCADPKESACHQPQPLRGSALVCVDPTKDGGYFCGSCTVGCLKDPISGNGTAGYKVAGTCMGGNTCVVHLSATTTPMTCNQLCSSKGFGCMDATFAKCSDAASFGENPCTCTFAPVAL